MAQGTRVAGATELRTPTVRRPGWVTFAAVASFVVGIFYALIAITEFADSYWMYNNLPAHAYNLVGSHLFWWGILDSIIAALAIGAGVSLLRGGFFGLWAAFSAAGISAIRWLFYIPMDPWLAITIIVLDILVIYGLCMSVDYFADTADV